MRFSLSMVPMHGLLGHYFFVMTMQLHYQGFRTYWACSRLFMTIYFCSCIWMQFCGVLGTTWSGQVRQHPLNHYSLLVLEQHSYSKNKDKEKNKNTSEIRGKLLTLTLQSDWLIESLMSIPIYLWEHKQSSNVNLKDSTINIP